MKQTSSHTEPPADGGGGRSVGRLLLLYLTPFSAVFLLLFGLASLVTRATPDVAGRLPQKLAYYQQHASEFDLVFIGDSRTFCGIHPMLIDPLLGSRSLNLSSFANWFPTQYPLVQDLIPILAPGTTVVWSIGHQNLFPVGGPIHDVYPVGVKNVARYLRWGYDWRVLAPNLINAHPLSMFIGMLDRRVISEKNRTVVSIEQALQRKLSGTSRAATPTVTTAPASGSGVSNAPQAVPAVNPRPSSPVPGLPPATLLTGPLASQKQALTDYYRTQSVVSRVQVFDDGGRLTSVALSANRGGHIRIELDPDYYRKIQQDDWQRRYGRFAPLDTGWADGIALPTEMAAEYVATFEATLDAFQQAGVDLIINEIEEAPYTYGHPHLRQRWRNWMREYVEPMVQQRGFTYVRADLDGLTDADYFDYNHLNSVGIIKYAPRLADALRPVLTRTDDAGAGR